jgi:hypothetical protein
LNGIDSGIGYSNRRVPKTFGDEFVFRAGVREECPSFWVGITGFKCNLGAGERGGYGWIESVIEHYLIYCHGF